MVQKTQIYEGESYGDTDIDGAVQCSTLHYIAVQCSAVQCRAATAVQCNLGQCNTVQ